MFENYFLLYSNLYADSEWIFCIRSSWINAYYNWLTFTYKETGGKLMAVLNYHEHVRVLSSSRNDIKAAFEEAATLLNTLEDKLQDQNHEFAWHETLGYVNGKSYRKRNL